jgi:hypothetical protein
MQAIFGTRGENLKTEMEDLSEAHRIYLKRAGPEADTFEEPSPVKAPPSAGFQPKLRDPDAPRRRGPSWRRSGDRTTSCAWKPVPRLACDSSCATGAGVQEPALRAEGIAALVSWTARPCIFFPDSTPINMPDMRGLLASGE